MYICFLNQLNLIQLHQSSVSKLFFLNYYEIGNTFIAKFSFFWVGHKNVYSLPYGFEIYLVNVKTMRTITQIFVAFSEKLNFTRPVAQSICNHYIYILVLKTWVGLWPWKKGLKYGLQKAGCKKQGHCYSNREGAAWPFLFLNNNDPVFCTLLFETHILDPIFIKFQTLEIYQANLIN